jgi:hypothetical protein
MYMNKLFNLDHFIQDSFVDKTGSNKSLALLENSSSVCKPRNIERKLSDGKFGVGNKMFLGHGVGSFADANKKAPPTLQRINHEHVLFAMKGRIFTHNELKISHFNKKLSASI